MFVSNMFGLEHFLPLVMKNRVQTTLSLSVLNLNIVAVETDCIVEEHVYELS